MNTIASNPPRTWHYFLAIALPAIVMIASLGINSFKLYQETQNTKTELEGLAHLTPLSDLTITLQKIRSITQLQRHGKAGLSDETKALKLQLNNQLSALKSSPDSFNLGIVDDLKQFERQTRYTLDAAEINTPAEIFLSHSALVNHSLEITRLSAERSMLTFDNDPKIYFLAKLLIDQISNLTESLGRVRGIGSGFILNEKVANNRQLTQELHTLKNHLNATHNSTTRALTENSESEKNISVMMSSLYKASDKFITKSEKLLTNEKHNIDVTSFFAESNLAITASLQLFNDIKKLLNNRLKKRLSQSQKTILYTMGGELIAILLMAFFVTSFYKKSNTAFQELQESIDSLYDSEAKNRAIINSAVDGVITINERGIILNVNPATEKLFGFSAPEMIGSNVDMLMPEHHQTRHDSYISRYLSTAKRKIIGIGREIEGVKKDGTFFPIELSVSEAPHQGQRIVTGTIHDISTRKLIERELMQHRNQLEFLVDERTAELNTLHDELKQFTHIASHDLISKLPTISKSSKTLSSLLKNRSLTKNTLTKSKINEMIKEISVIEKNSAQLEWDLNTLIKLSGAGLKTLFIEKVDMNHISHEIRKDIKAQLKANKIRLSIGDLPTVATDREAVKQIMTNLIYNAIKQLPADRPGIIEVNAETHDDQYFFYVKDNGPGLSSDDIRHIFDPFKERDGNNASGDGIGLAYAIYLNRRLGGDLSYQSEQAQGNLLSFSLPIRNSHTPSITPDNINIGTPPSASGHAIAS